MTELKFADYGQLKEIGCTEEELMIFDLLRDMTGANDLELVRRTDKYITAAIGETDVARFKFTSRAKWILFPCVRDDKIKIKDVADVSDQADDACRAVELARQLNG